MRQLYHVTGIATLTRNIFSARTKFLIVKKLSKGQIAGLCHAQQNCFLHENGHKKCAFAISLPRGRQHHLAAKIFLP
jgi:hypothetical protein